MNHHQQDGPGLAHFVIEASAAEAMAQTMNLPSVAALLPHIVPAAKSLARPPISDYHVGAVGLGSDGRVFVGVNLEFPGLPLHHSVHAEQFLLTNLAIHRCPGLLSLAVSSAPCGHCRQFLQELRRSPSLQILVTGDGDRDPAENPDFKPLPEFLPNPFGPHDLLDGETPLILEQRDHRLELLPSLNSGKSVNGKCDNFKANEILLREAALEAANNSHAPYSGCPSGVALMDCGGNLYKGSYMESAAFNPSLGPVQAALVAYVSGGGGSYNRIVGAALAEKTGSKVRQEDTARLLLKAISPNCVFQAFHCGSVEKDSQNVSA